MSSEKAVAPHSSTLAWEIPWTEEPGGLQSRGSLRVGYDWVTSLSLSCIGDGNGNPLQCSCLENSRDGGAWGAAIYGVTQSRTRLKWLSSSSSSSSSGRTWAQYMKINSVSVNYQNSAIKWKNSTTYSTKLWNSSKAGQRPLSTLRTKSVV